MGYGIKSMRPIFKTEMLTYQSKAYGAKSFHCAPSAHISMTDCFQLASPLVDLAEIRKK